MRYFEFSQTELKRLGGFQTAEEISHQPNVWAVTTDKFIGEVKLIQKFIKKALQEVDQIVFTGAGTSAFIGYSLTGVFFEHLKKPCHEIATTDIVTFPEYYFNHAHSYLIISFARSGMSPESVAALRSADKYSKKCFHLIITCNERGDLSNYKSVNPICVFSLPDSTNDKGLAMTSSYSSMLLTGLLTAISFEKNNIVKAREQVELSMKLSQKTLDKEVDILKNIATADFKRAVFLGSGTLLGTATEAALKLQELTNGTIICKSDSFMGFRHGPKAVINEETLVVYFFNNNKYVQQYEMDLLHDMERGAHALVHLGISDRRIATTQLDDQINIFEPGKYMTEPFQALNYIVPVQMLAFFKSLQLGLKPDTPSTNGAISRVVEGVHIYPLKN